MTIIRVVQGNLPRWLRKFRLSDISLQEVRADEIALEREEKRLDEALERGEAEVAAITAATVSSGQTTRARRAARKIMQIQERSRVCEQQLAQVSHYLTALGRLRRLVEGKEELAANGVLGTLQGLPQATLERVMAGAGAREELTNEGLSRVADLLDLPPQQAVHESMEERQLREALESAIEARDPALAGVANGATNVAPSEREAY